MYFVALSQIKSQPRHLIEKIDDCLKQFHSSSTHFTPKSVSNLTGISLDVCWDILLHARNLGVIQTLFVNKCKKCDNVQKTKLDNSQMKCKECSNSKMKEGYYFTTVLHQS